MRSVMWQRWLGLNIWPNVVFSLAVLILIWTKSTEAEHNHFNQRRNKSMDVCNMGSLYDKCFKFKGVLWFIVWPLLQAAEAYHTASSKPKGSLKWLFCVQLCSHLIWLKSSLYEPTVRLKVSQQRSVFQSGCEAFRHTNENIDFQMNSCVTPGWRGLVCCRLIRPTAVHLTDETLQWWKDWRARNGGGGGHDGSLVSQLSFCIVVSSNVTVSWQLLWFY